MNLDEIFFLKGVKGTAAENIYPVSVDRLSTSITNKSSKRELANDCEKRSKHKTDK